MARLLVCTGVTYLDRIRVRVVQDALTEALPLYWERRAQMFEWAHHRPGDHVGTEMTVELIEEKNLELQDLADECRRRGRAREGLGVDFWGPVLDQLMEESE